MGATGATGSREDDVTARLAFIAGYERDLQAVDSAPADPRMGGLKQPSC